jgi:hypothetical protein
MDAVESSLVHCCQDLQANAKKIVEFIAVTAEELQSMGESDKVLKKVTRQIPALEDSLLQMLSAAEKPKQLLKSLQSPALLDALQSGDESRLAAALPQLQLPNLAQLKLSREYLDFKGKLKVRRKPE